MNPLIPTDYHETGHWLEGFVRSHAKRESPRIEVLLDTTGARDGHSYGVRLALDERRQPPLGSPPIELGFRDVAEGRARFEWNAALAERIRGSARQLVGTA
jgi:hypothetical protein